MARALALSDTTRYFPGSSGLSPGHAVCFPAPYYLGCALRPTHRIQLLFTGAGRTARAEIELDRRHRPSSRRSFNPSSRACPATRRRAVALRGRAHPRWRRPSSAVREITRPTKTAFAWRACDGVPRAWRFPAWRTRQPNAGLDRASARQGHPSWVLPRFIDGGRPHGGVVRNGTASIISQLASPIVLGRRAGAGSVRGRAFAPSSPDAAPVTEVRAIDRGRPVEDELESAGAAA